MRTRTIATSTEEEQPIPLTGSSSRCCTFDAVVGDAPDGGGEGGHRGSKRVPKLNSQIDQISIHEESGEGVPLLEPGGVAASTASMACMSLGVGVFVLPSVFQEIGLLLGIGLVVFFGLLSNCAIIFLYQVAERHSAGSFEELMVLAFGRKGRPWVPFFVATACAIANAAHLQFVADIVRDMAEWFCTGKFGEEMPPLGRALIIFGFGALVMPFCFAPTINSLRYASTISVAYVILMCILCSGFAFGEIHKNHGTLQNTDRLANFGVSSLASSMPVVAFAYSSVVAFFPVYRESKEPTKMPRCVHTATTICCTFYSLVAIIGVLAFANPAPDYLYSFPPDNWAITVGCMGLVVVIVLLYPVINFPLVCGIDSVLYPDRVSSQYRRRIYSVVVLFIIVVLDVLVPKIKMVFGLAGSLGLGMVAYTLPAGTYLALCRRPYLKMGLLIEPRLSVPLFLLAVFILIVGLTLVIGSTTSIIISAAKGE